VVVEAEVVEVEAALEVAVAPAVVAEVVWEEAVHNVVARWECPP
jgi:hypothetical protein